nr:MAG TPA: HTH domain protein [Caudoviricetes sp.]
MAKFEMLPGVIYSRANLAALLGVPDRQMRRVIREQRRQGVPIVAMPEGGYKLAETEAEKKRLLAMYRVRAMDEFETYKMLAAYLRGEGE